MLAPRWARFAPVPALVAFLGHAALLYRATMGHTDGAPTYPVDDAFIHLALAKHIAWSGVYGVTSSEFTSASSSVIWPWLLAATLRIFGDSARAPFILNLIIGAGVPFAIDRGLRVLGNGEISGLRRMLVTLIAVIVIPLPTLAVIGMEHTLHALATILFVTSAAVLVADPKVKPRDAALLAMLTAASRYEAAFIIGAVCAMLAIRKRWRDAIVVGGAGAAPVVLFGLFAVTHGSTFFPTSVLLKRRPFVFKDLSDASDALGGDLFNRFATESHLLALGLVCMALTWWVLRAEGPWSKQGAALVITLAGLMAHMELAGLGWFYRYDSYLVALLVTVTGAVACARAPKVTRAGFRTAPQWIFLLGVVCVVGCLWRRAGEAAKYTPTAGGNIFEQQVQTARFLTRYFPSDLVAINDIGAVAYYREGPFVDLVGLADIRVARAKKMRLDEPMSEADFLRLTNGVKVAVIYDEWFKGLVPRTWFKVASFTIENNRSCASATVAVYATDAKEIGRVLAAARAFSTNDIAKSVRTIGPATLPRALGSIHSGDAIEVIVEGSEKLRGAFSVAEDGTVEIPGVRSTLVRGKNEQEAAAALDESIRAANDDVKKDAGAAHVRIIQRALAHVYVTGHVFRNAILQGSDVTLERALEAADPSPDADAMHATIWRDADDGPHEISRDVAEGAPLLDNDIVVIPGKSP